MIYLVNRVTWGTFAITVVEHNGYTAEVTHQIEIREPTQETGLVDIVLFRLLVEERSIRHLVNYHVGTVDSRIVLFPGITNEEVSGLNGKVAEFADVSGVCLSTCLHIVGLQVVEIDTLVVEHTIESVNSKFLINTIDSSLDIFLALIEIFLVNGADGTLFKVGAAAQC